LVAPMRLLSHSHSRSLPLLVPGLSSSHLSVGVPTPGATFRYHSARPGPIFRWSRWRFRLRRWSLAPLWCRRPTDSIAPAPTEEGPRQAWTPTPWLVGAGLRGVDRPAVGWRQGRRFGAFDPCIRRYCISSGVIPRAASSAHQSKHSNQLSHIAFHNKFLPYYVSVAMGYRPGGWVDSIF